MGAVKTCNLAIDHYQGSVFQRQGDGIVTFFGYPQAHEGDADRAIRAALEIVDSLSKLEVPELRVPELKGLTIDHLQASWVKQGVAMAQACLNAGADDLGGTLMNESISTAAGASNGHFMRPRDMRNAIRGVNRLPAERSTTYAIRREFREGTEPDDPLDRIESERAFGSYHSLIASSAFRFKTVS